MKISIIGAGNVGSTCAYILAKKNIVNEIILLDIKENLAKGKAIDIYQASQINGSNTFVLGVTNDYRYTSNSEVVVITSGLPRRPGMSREDLIHFNADIIKSVVSKVIHFSQNSKLIIVSNPLDVMTYVAFLTAIKNGKSKEWASKNIIGMAGILDKSRYCTFIADELHCSAQDIQALLLGGHGNTMIPLPRYTSVCGIPIQKLMEKEEILNIVESTKMGGGEIVKLLGTSAWYAPADSAAQMVEAIVKDSLRILPCSVWLSGEYNLKEIFLGVPILLGKNGIEYILELDLNEEEKYLLKVSSTHIKEMMNIIDNYL